MANTTAPVLPTNPMPAAQSGSVCVTVPAVDLRTQFCTAEGWFAYRDLTQAMRRVILSARDGAGLVKFPSSKRTEDALLGMGLIERQGNLFRLTYHGELLWCELDEV